MRDRGFTLDLDGAGIPRLRTGIDIAIPSDNFRCIMKYVKIILGIVILWLLC